VQEYGATHMGDVYVGYGDRKAKVEGDTPGDVSESDLTGAIVKITSDKVKTVVSSGVTAKDL